MEKLLEAAKVAWNPVGASRERLMNGTFTLVNMLVPYIGIVITCNLLAIGAQQFFYESLLFAFGGQMPNHPFLNNDFAQKALAVIQVLVPLAAIALLPAAMFSPSTRNAVLSAVLAVAAAMAFYGAAMGIPVYVLTGILVSGDPEFGVNLLFSAVVPVTIVQAILLITFWFRITGSVLGINGGKSLGILLTGGASLGILILAVMSAMSVSL